MVRRLPTLVLSLLALAVSGCGLQQEGPLDVVWIGSQEDLLAEGLRLSAGAQHVRAATQAGLVALDAHGDVVPALAERWIITDDGLSFIFRLREERWSDGSPLTSDAVRRGLLRVIDDLDGTSLGLDLAPITEIRAMTGRVIEIRLSAPVPDLLILLAQPELAVNSPETSFGPMTLARDAENERLLLSFRPPEERGLPEMPDWQEDVRSIALYAAKGEAALARFDDGDAEIVIGGRINQLPLVDTGPLSRGTVQVDAAIGLFGLQVMHDDGLLGEQPVREALAMALNRPALMASFNLDGWVPTTRLVTPGLPSDGGLVSERWATVPLEELRASGRRRVQDALAAGLGAGSAQLTLAMGSGPGLDRLFADLARQLGTIGITLVRVEEGATSDLVLVDRVARYPDARWFLNQFACSLRRGLCDDDADYLIEVANETLDPTERSGLLADAERELLRENVFIPIGAPLRWSLVRNNVPGFTPNQFAFHPLPPMAQIPR